MADNKNVPDNFDNFKNYEDKIKMASEKELKLFKDFYEEIKAHADGHKQATLNNLHQSKESLSELKEKAETLKDGVFYHDETVIVDRQAIISQTEDAVHKENRNLIDFEFNQAGERIDSLDYLNKALLQTKYNFFDRFRDLYTNKILDFDFLYSFYQEKVTEFDDILNKYHAEILKSFQDLDNEITDMDTRILMLIQQKNSKLNDVNTFYSDEMKNYLDNQLTFTLDENPNSSTMKSLIADKTSQLERFRNHLLEQEEKVKKILQQEYLSLYNKTLTRLLKRKGNELFEDTMFFMHPEEKIKEFKNNILLAEEKDFVTLKHHVNLYNNAIKHKKYHNDCEKRAKQLTKGFMNLKKGIFLEYQKESRNLIFQIEKYFKLYLELMTIDPFLAQIIGDKSTKIIKDEINFLSILQMNKEHKINVNFDIKTLKLKQNINEIEKQLSYLSEKLMIRQDIDLLNTLSDIQLFFAKYQGDSALILNSLGKEKFLIEKLEKAINHHMEFQVRESNLNRKFLSMITQVLESNIREKENHNINVVNAASRIKLALKEYDILALHFNTMYDNEKRFLVIQANRVGEETKINNEFVLTTFENQMRFASEQIMLANDEYRLRVEAIMRAVDEEREYYKDMVKHRLKDYQSKQKNISDEYQAKLYYDTFMITEIEDQKHIKSLERQIVKNRRAHDELIGEIEKQIAEDQVISEAKTRLRELDAHLQVALEDAAVLRDDTIREMTDMYQEAKKRFEVLKPYLENKVNVLDPTFYQMMESSKKRHQQKVAEAQKDLDLKTKDLLDDYLKVYFEEQPEINKELYLSQIDQLQEERDQLKLDYADKVAKSELLYNSKVNNLEKEVNQITQNVANLNTNILLKSERAIQQKLTELDSLDKRYDLEGDKQQGSFQKEISDLTLEYNSSLVQNQKYYHNLSDAFDRILQTYYPYLKVARNNKVIKQVVKINEKRMKNIKQKETKKLVKESKLADYLSD